jgi:hypothetical protein
LKPHLLSDTLPDPKNNLCPDGLTQWNLTPLLSFPAFEMQGVYLAKKGIQNHKNLFCRLPNKEAGYDFFTFFKIIAISV